ncbi:unnamed protein product [Pararhodospirillum photometricum DSM 122]|uniref:Uncharacterized protein n=1 Tax=Pararhodospirillum photometricum DSM 122 TaxID=1150469 RepID=H6SLJ4_PARPM|nr:unnamed protein product [Pararhodospirillum photometricum DSM 122]
MFFIEAKRDAVRHNCAILWRRMYIPLKFFQIVLSGRRKTPCVEGFIMAISYNIIHIFSEVMKHLPKLTGQ